jgi:hypothetical protein
MGPFLVLTSIWCVKDKTCPKHIKCFFAAKARRCRQGCAGEYNFFSFVFTPLFWCQLLTKTTGKWSRTLLCVTRLPLSWIVSLCCIGGVEVHQLKTIGSRVTALFHSLSLLPSYQLGWSANQICSKHFHKEPWLDAVEHPLGHSNFWVPCGSKRRKITVKLGWLTISRRFLWV